tara:strand:+ start:979 stop:1896 length:918 start_codon:yes stop_codon:yes gene_type:complete
MSILNKIKKISTLEIFLFVLIISLGIVIFCKNNKEGFIVEKPTFVKHTDIDIYDDFYSEVYDQLVFDKIRRDYEIDCIFDRNINNNNKNLFVLDIGSGTGHHIDSINKLKIKSVGIDNSKSMVQKAKNNFPSCRFKHANVLQSILFPQDTFSHILCLYFTIYYFKNKRLFLQNCFNWLQPNGILVLHLVNMKKFDPILPSCKNGRFINDKTRPTQSEIEFELFDYKSNFTIDSKVKSKESNAIFKETFKFHDSKKTRINEHHLFMEPQETILAIAKDIGFILQSQTEMIEIDYNYNYIYTLQKPF